MSLRKRIEKLEQVQKQTTCEHIYFGFQVEQIGGTTFRIKSDCRLCDKMTFRTDSGEKINTACKFLQNFVLRKE